MMRFLRRGLLLGLAAFFLCCTLGCTSSKEKKEEPQKTWGDDTRQHILEAGE